MGPPTSPPFRSMDSPSRTTFSHALRRRRARFVTLLVGTAAALSGCADARPQWQEDGDLRWRPLRVDEGAPGFTQLSPRSTGIAFVNDPSEEMTTLNQHLANGGGVAIGDVDGDGLADVLFANTRGENALYLNRGRLRFERVDAGVRLPDRHPTGVVLADVDGDRDLDALFSAMGAPVAFLENDGSGFFTDVSERAGFSLSRAGSTLTLADIDADGDLDLYAANYRLERAADAFSPADRRETPVLAERDGEWVVNEMYRDFYRVVVGPEGVMSWEFGEEDDLYINRGDGTFDREPVLGPRFLDAAGAPLQDEPQEWGLAARFHDLNLDGAPDLYVANDFESPDYVWINQGDGTFQALGAPDLRKTSHASMSVAFADVDANGTSDIFVADMLPLSSKLRKTQVSTLMERRPQPGDLGSIMQVNRNTLLLAVPGGGYVESAQQAGVEASGWTWATEFLDVDLDAFPDLLAVNGHRWDPLDADTGDRLRRSQATAGADWHEVINLFPQLRLSNRAFRNLGDGTFEAAENGWGLDAGPDISHGLAAGDLDGDGDLDLVVNRLGDPALVLRNDAGAPRLAVRLVGLAPNTAAIGARITVTGGPARQTREVGAGGLYLSHSDGMQTFAAGDARALAVEVRWPDGSVTEVGTVEPGRLYEIRQGDSAAPAAADPSPDSRDAPQALFSEIDVAHGHVDAPYVASRLQPLLPRELSRLGPGVTWTDTDADGDVDLVVGGGAGGDITELRNQAGSLQPRVVSRALPVDVTTLLPDPGRRALLVGVANYETPSPDSARSVPPAWLVPLAGGARRSALSSDGASTGPMASADIDLDGDLDVFVGGRVYQGAYPLVPTSRFFVRGPDGTLMHDSAASAPIARAGMVSGAVFTDVDGDGDPDLVLAVDWGHLRLFVNDGGRFTERSREWGLTAYASWWNGVTAGDFDGDGRMDLVATAWGRNTGLRPRPDRPLLAYWGDFDRSGTLDVLLAQHDGRIGAVSPISDLPTVSRGLPFVRRQTTPTFEAYADASVARVLGPSLEAATVSQITTLDHMVFLNRGTRFEARPLPGPAQLAPAHGVAVADFDGDGAEDLALAQNFFPNALGEERQDAGRGLVMLGDGNGNLIPLTPAASGVTLAGDQRGLAVADFDADGRPDLAVGQNSGPTVVLRNASGSPGLRVRLRAGPGNPWGVGASVRVIYEDGSGPAREVRMGSGFWSVDDPVVVLGLREEPVAVEVRWPGGHVERVDVAEGAREITLERG